MRKIILASHGDLSRGMMDTIEMIAGNQGEGLIHYRLGYGDIASDYSNRLEQEVKAQPETEFIVCTDLAGASVNSAMLPLTRYPNVHVFAGMNVAMILEILLSYPSRLSRQDVESIIEISRQSIQSERIQEVGKFEMEEF